MNYHQRVRLSFSHPPSLNDYCYCLPLTTITFSGIPLRSRALQRSTQCKGEAVSAPRYNECSRWSDRWETNEQRERAKKWTRGSRVVHIAVEINHATRQRNRQKATRTSTTIRWGGGAKLGKSCSLILVRFKPQMAQPLTLLHLLALQLQALRRFQFRCRKQPERQLP